MHRLLIQVAEIHPTDQVVYTCLFAQDAVFLDAGFWSAEDHLVFFVVTDGSKLTR